MTGIGEVRPLCQPGYARCAQMPRWLAGLGADAKVIDVTVTADAAAQAELARRGLRGLPVVMTSGGNAAQGADPARLAAALPLLARAARARRPSSPEAVAIGPGRNQARAPTISQGNTDLAEKRR